MALDMLVDSAQLNSDLTAIANAIRAKTGQTGKLTFPTGMVNAIASIASGGGGGGGGTAVSIGTATKTPTSAASSIQFTGLLGEPTSFVVISKSNLSTGASPYKAAVVVFDGTDIFGQYITNTSNAQMTYSATAFTKQYSNGTLTVTASGANFQANQYLLIYSYGGSVSDVKTAEVQVGSGATQIAFTGLAAEPKYFSCVFKGNFGTASGYARANAIVSDGDSVSGLYMGSADTASANSWTATYNNGTLTIKSTSSSNGGYFHQPGYYQLTYVE